MNKRQKSVIDHALALFLEKGIQNTSVQDIIERAGISKGTFYNYFSSKNECIAAILDQFYYESSLSRSELLIGKDAKDLDLLIDQITLLLQFNEKRGMNAIYEEILYLGDRELRQLVLKYRISEHEWLTERLIEVYGDELRPYAFESSVLLFGMLHHLLFIRKLLHQHDRELRSIMTSLFYYMEFIIQGLIRHHTAVLDHDHLIYIKDHLNRQPIKKSDSIILLQELLDESNLTRSQIELTQALLYELEQDDMRRSVISALLQSFTETFEDSPHYKISKEISTMVWYYLKTHQ